MTMKLYYEKMCEINNLSDFLKVAHGREHYEGYILENEIKNILWYEKTFTLFVQAEISKFGYNIDINSPYIAGIGSTSIAYFVTNKMHESRIAKFIWGFEKQKIFASEISAVALVTECDMQAWIPKYYETYTTSEYINGIDGYCLIFEEYTGVTLTEFVLTSTPCERKLILSQLRDLRSEMLENNIVNTDFSMDNLTVDNWLNLKMIDISDVKERTIESLVAFNECYQIIVDKL